jgi:hypothetical protein
MRLLDLFCGAGGAGAGYHRAGFDVVGVDIKPQPHYPFAFHQADALEYVAAHGNEYEVIHASPPCQRYSTITHAAGTPDDQPDLVGITRDLLRAVGVPWIIENVPGAPLVKDAPLFGGIMLCGSMFGLGVRRHRCFESSMPLSQMPCRHDFEMPHYEVYDHGKWYSSALVPVYGRGGGKAVDSWPLAMGIGWMTRDELTQAIPPAYTEWVGRQMLAALERDTH